MSRYKILAGIGVLGAGAVTLFFFNKSFNEVVDSFMDFDYSEDHLWVWN
jgi:hypothetical protein